MKTFLNDCSGLSEFMAKIYRFRSKIIRLQRWIKSWIEVQYNRVRILYIYAEKLTKQTLQLEKMKKMKEDKWSVKAVEHVQGFGNAIIGIKSVQNRLNKLLIDHQYQKVNREREMHLYEEERKKLKIIKLGKSKMDPSSIMNMLNTSGFNRTKKVVISAMPRATNVWLRKRKNNKIQWETVMKLMRIITKERRRHIMAFEESKRKVLDKEVKISEKILKQFLKGTNDIQKVENVINNSILKDSIEFSKPVEERYGNFLLYTKGGLESIRNMISEDNRSLLF